MMQSAVDLVLALWRYLPALALRPAMYLGLDARASVVDALIENTYFLATSICPTWSGDCMQYGKSFYNSIREKHGIDPPQTLGSYLEWVEPDPRQAVLNCVRFHELYIAHLLHASIVTSWPPDESAAPEMTTVSGDHVFLDTDGTLIWGFEFDRALDASNPLANGAISRTREVLALLPGWKTARFDRKLKRRAQFDRVKYAEGRPRPDWRQIKHEFRLMLTEAELKLVRERGRHHQILATMSSECPWELADLANQNPEDVLSVGVLATYDLERPCEYRSRYMLEAAKFLGPDPFSDNLHMVPDRMWRILDHLGRLDPDNGLPDLLRASVLAKFGLMVEATRALTSAAKRPTLELYDTPLRIALVQAMDMAGVNPVLGRVHALGWSLARTPLITLDSCLLDRRDCPPAARRAAAVLGRRLETSPLIMDVMVGLKWQEHSPSTRKHVDATRRELTGLLDKIRALPVSTISEERWIRHYDDAFSRSEAEAIRELIAEHPGP